MGSLALDFSPSRMNSRLQSSLPAAFATILIIVLVSAQVKSQVTFSRDWLAGTGKRSESPDQFSRDWLTSGGKRFSRDWLTSGGKRSLRSPSTSMDTSTCIKKSLENYVNDILTCLSVDATPLNQNEVPPQRGVALRSFLF